MVTSGGDESNKSKDETNANPRALRLSSYIFTRERVQSREIKIKITIPLQTEVEKSSPFTVKLTRCSTKSVYSIPSVYRQINTVALCVRQAHKRFNKIG